MKKYVLKTDENGNEITVADVHKVLLEMLKMIDGICQKYNIPYFLNGGSALGAIRHQGFIPWDDDADIAMLYEDYKRFIVALKQDLPQEYTFQCFDTDKRYNPLIPGMKIRKTGTYLKEVNTLLANRCTECDGIFIDVFVYDYCSASKTMDLPLRMLNQLIMPFIILFDNLGMNPVFLSKFSTSLRDTGSRLAVGSSRIISLG